jgi:predicted regulator of Ras-like GTPase activity (Roadblock/LC7/MglB family)
MHTMPILTFEAAGSLDKVLENFLEHSEASFTLVIDRGGAVLSEHGQIPSSIDPTILAALAAGSFAATRELALRVGETEFSALHQQGRQSQILMSAINDDAVLMTVFGPKTTLGLVRFYSTSAVKQIAVVLERACSESQIPIDLGSELANGLSEVFQDPSRGA